MKFLLAGWLAVGCALLWERLLLFFHVGEKLRVGVFIPLGEECIKFGVFYYCKLNPVAIFMLFGFGEGLYESYHPSNGFQFKLLLTGIFLHGFLSVFYILGLPLWMGFLLAFLSHSIWNLMILKKAQV